MIINTLIATLTNPQTNFITKKKGTKSSLDLSRWLLGWRAAVRLLQAQEVLKKLVY